MATATRTETVTLELSRLEADELADYLGAYSGDDGGAADDILDALQDALAPF